LAASLSRSAMVRQDVLDLRHFAASSLRDLLSEETEVWQKRLRWEWAIFTDGTMVFIIVSDATTSSLIGAYLNADGALDSIGPEYRASQGRELGRDGYVTVRVDRVTGEVEIGGQSVTCIDGILKLPSA